MNHFNQLREFEKELKKLKKKYQSLLSDLSNFEEVLKKYPIGTGKNFEILHYGENVKIVKARLSCDSLRDRSIRIIYAYHNNTFDFMYIEIYFKGDKVNEDRKRIDDYLKSL